MNGVQFTLMNCLTSFQAAIHPIQLLIYWSRDTILHFTLSVVLQHSDKNKVE